MLENSQTRKNADGPYDSVEIISAGGVYKAVFYNAAVRRTTDREEWPADTLDVLEERRQHFHSQGYVTPLIDKAITLLKQAQQDQPAPE